MVNHTFMALVPKLTLMGPKTEWLLDFRPHDVYRFRFIVEQYGDRHSKVSFLQGLTDTYPVMAPPGATMTSSGDEQAELLDGRIFLLDGDKDYVLSCQGTKLVEFTNFHEIPFLELNRLHRVKVAKYG